MVVIGLTGPSGSGKSEVARFLSKYHIEYIDADVVYHNLIVPPSPCLDEIIEVFGYGILNPGGQLDRHALSKLVFGKENSDKLEKLNLITHKYVCARINQILRYYDSQNVRCCIIDAPLLIESGLNNVCDFVISILANKNLRAERIALRDNISFDNAISRIDSQKPDDFYIENSDVVLYNDENKENLQKNIISLFKQKKILEGID